MATPYQYENPPATCRNKKAWWERQHNKRQTRDYGYACLVEKREAAEKKRAEASK